MKRIAPLMFAALVVLSCTDDQPPATAPFSNAPQAAIVDGANGGNPHFYWLPELVESPTYTGTFNPDIPAVVKICKLVPGVLTSEAPEPTEPECVVGDIQTLFAAADVSVDAVNEQYSAVWKTDVALPDGSFIDSNNYYRLSVWVGQFELGYRDLDPEDSPPSGSGGKLLPYYPFKLGNTINLKFRIEAGAFCLSGDPENCGECFYTETGADDGNNEVVGRACNADDQHGVYIPETLAIDGVLVIPERIVGKVTLSDGRTLNCTPDNVPNSPTYGQVNFIQGLDIPQYPGCFFIRTIPEITPSIDLGAIVGSCPEIPAGAPDRLAVIARTDDANNPSYVQALKPASTVVNGEDFLNCDEPASPLQSLAMAVKKLNPFYAEPVEAGKLGSLKGAESPSFSDFVWIVPSQEEKLAGDNQVGLKGTVLPEPLTVSLTDEVSANIRATQNLPVAGATVTFSFPEGGLSVPAADNTCSTGSATALDVTTGLGGEAKVCVTLPGTVGVYSVFVSGYGIGVKNEAWSINSVNGTGPYSHWNTGSPFVGNPITLPNPPTSVEFTVTACEPGFGSIGDGGIDGALSEGEWDCAEQPPTEFEANTGGGKKTGLVLQMADNDFLYLAVQIPVDETASLKENTLTVYLNDEDADLLGSGHDILVVDGTKEVGSQFSDQYWAEGKCPKGQSFCALVDPTSAGSGAYQLNYDENGAPAFYFYEIKIPRVGDCDYDVCYEEGVNSIRYFFTVRGLGSGNKGNTEYPGPFGEYAQDPLLP
jgi:hypothetical protein